MSTFDDNFSMELKYPLDEKTLDILMDAELNNTKRIFFKTKSGKEVAFIKEDVLDKIRAEIEEVELNITYEENYKVGVTWGLRKALEIIDKYKAESEEE